MRTIFDEGDVVQTKLGAKFKIVSLEMLDKDFTRYKGLQLFEDKKSQTFSEAESSTMLYDDNTGNFSYVMPFSKFAEAVKSPEKQIS